MGTKVTYEGYCNPKHQQFHQKMLSVFSAVLVFILNQTRIRLYMGDRGDYCSFILYSIRSWCCTFHPLFVLFLFSFSRHLFKFVCGESSQRISELLVYVVVGYRNNRMFWTEIMMHGFPKMLSSVIQNFIHSFIYYACINSI